MFLVWVSAWRMANSFAFRMFWNPGSHFASFIWWMGAIDVEAC